MDVSTAPPPVLPTTEPAAGPVRTDASEVITPVVRDGDRRRARLIVDQTHPFFFDHPLDHVSGMLLVTGLLDVVRPELVAVPRIRLSIKFVRICELDRPVSLVASPMTGGGWLLRAMQGDDLVCAGAVDVLDCVPVHMVAPEAEPAVPITSSAVHRADDANVVLGEPVVTSSCFDVPLLTPPSGHFLLRHGECNYAVEELVEAGRQLATAASHESHGRAADSQLLWLGLTAELPPAMVRGVPLALRWPVSPPHGTLSLFDFTLVTRNGHRPVGCLSYAIKSYRSAAYAGMRDRGSRAA